MLNNFAKLTAQLFHDNVTVPGYIKAAISFADVQQTACLQNTRKKVSL